MRDETKNATEVEMTTSNSERTASKVDVGIHLSEQEVVTDALFKNGAKTQELERVNIGSNKICIREDLAEDKMVFSEESTRAIFEMGNVELIELKKSSMQCPSCLHHVFEGTFSCMCGKLIRTQQRCDEPDSRSHRSSQGTILPHVFDCHKR